MRVAALLLLLLITVEAELLAVRMVLREGSSYPLNNSYGNFSERDAGRLTDVGKHMHYLLGRKLSQQYWKELGLTDRYHQHYFQFNSSGENRYFRNAHRTIESMSCCLAGLLEGLPLDTLNNSELAQPVWSEVIHGKEGLSFMGGAYHTVPIHSARRFWNVYDEATTMKSLSPLAMLCPAVERWTIENQQSSFFKKKIKPIVDQNAEQLLRRIGGKINLENISLIMQTYQFNKSMGWSTHPALNDPALRKDLEYLYLAKYFADGLLTELQINATVSEAFIKLREQFRQAIFGTSLKMVMYSGNEADVISQLAGLGLMSGQCLFSYFIGGTARCVLETPRFASSLIYELHRSNGNQYVKVSWRKIQVRYNGIYKRLLFCEYPCLYLDFERHLNATINSEYKNLCGFILDRKPIFTFTISSKEVALMIGIGVVSFVLLAYFTCKLIKEVMARNGEMLTLMTDRKREEATAPSTANEIAAVSAPHLSDSRLHQQSLNKTSS